MNKRMVYLTVVIITAAGCAQVPPWKHHAGVEKKHGEGLAALPVTLPDRATGDAVEQPPDEEPGARVTGLLRQLASDSYKDRVNAYTGLEELIEGNWDSLVVERLLKARESTSDPEVKEQLGRLLAMFFTAERLVLKLRNEDYRVRGSIEEALMAIGTPAVGPLTAALKDESAHVRASAARVLGKLGDKRAVEHLMQALKDHDGQVRRYAAEGLYMIPDKKAVDALIEVLKDGNTAAALFAARALEKIGEAAVDSLTEVLKHEEPTARLFVAQTLGSIGDRRAVEPLIKALKDEDAGVSGAAACALGGIGDRSAVEALTEALRGKSEYTRGCAAEALGDLGDKRSIEALGSVLEDEVWYVRMNAARALGKIGGESAVGLLTKALKDKNSSVRAWAAEALKEIAKRDSGRTTGGGRNGTTGK